MRRRLLQQSALGCQESTRGTTHGSMPPLRGPLQCSAKRAASRRSSPDEPLPHTTKVTASVAAHCRTTRERHRLQKKHLWSGKRSERHANQESTWHRHTSCCGIDSKRVTQPYEAATTCAQSTAHTPTPTARETEARHIPPGGVTSEERARAREYAARRHKSAQRR